jgi:hypothetical protein
MSITRRHLKSYIIVFLSENGRSSSHQIQNACNNHFNRGCSIREVSNILPVMKDKITAIDRGKSKLYELKEATTCTQRNME